MTDDAQANTSSCAIPAKTDPEHDKIRPLSRSALYDLVEQGAISGTTFEEALRLSGIRPGVKEWGVYGYHLLCLCGALLLASGMIFFIAWNWNSLPQYAKFGILEAVIATGVLVSVWRGGENVVGGAALYVSALCFGPLLAVFGQTYMSGAHLWELFRA